MREGETREIVRREQAAGPGQDPPLSEGNEKVVPPHRQDRNLNIFVFKLLFWIKITSCVELHKVLRQAENP